MSICINNNIKEVNFIGILNSPNNISQTKNNYSEPKRLLVSSKRLKPKNNSIVKNISNLNDNIYDINSNNSNNNLKNLHIVNINKDIYSNENILTKDRIMENIKMGVLKNYKILNNLKNRNSSSTTKIQNPNMNNDQFYLYD